jgi:threonylcarbamoyladenosine tRNA methylthiotransferase MtaB
VERIAALRGDFRIRLSSLDPREITPRLLGLVADGGRVCPHLHVSVQSLSDAVLAAMHRPYENTADVAERLRELRRQRPAVAVGGDFIVGFPGETERMFETTLERLEQAGFCYGHVFRFSPRPGTPAASFSGQVTEHIKRGRSERLREVLGARRARFARSRIGEHEKIVVEREEPVEGVTGNYLRTEVRDAEARRGRWMSVRVTDYDTGTNRCVARAVAGEGA